MSAPTETLEKSYSADSARESFLTHALAALRYPALLRKHHYLVQNFFRRELLGRFRGSALGLFWVLVHPIFLFVVYYLVFGYLFGVGKVSKDQPPDPHFAIYLFSGVIAFTALNESLTRACMCVVENGNLVKKVAFPSELLPVHTTLIALMVYLVGASVCLAVGTAFGVLQPGWTLLLLPLVLVVQFVFSLGLGLLLANLHVFARDTSHLWSILSMAWMFLTPVFWFPAQLEANLGDGLATLLRWNPAYPLLQAHRIALGGVDARVGEQMVELGSIGDHLLVASLWAVAFLFVGHGLFHSRKHQYADLV